MGSIEESIQNNMFRGQQERTLIDKVLGKDDINEIKAIQMKPELTRSDILKLLYLLTSAESKLHNFNERDRYVLLKYFVWIREAVNHLETLYDFQESLEKKENVCSNCNMQIIADDTSKLCKCKNPKVRSLLSDRGKRLLRNNKLLLEHVVKFLCDVYLNIARTSMSLGATGFDKLITNKYEMVYPGLNQTVQVEKKGWLGLGGK